MKITLEMIGALEAGDRLNTLVAEHVMGKRWINLPPAAGKTSRAINMLVEPDEMPTWRHAYPELVEGFHDGANISTSGADRYSDDIASAWRVVERMKRLEETTNLGPLWNNFWEAGYVKMRDLAAAEAALNICRAALAAVVIETPSYAEVFGQLQKAYLPQTA
ncbi:MAG: Phage sandwich domain [Hymenobacter sp.]|nr:Phage sandwich domain [Hymenobacter sp.]